MNYLLMVRGLAFLFLVLGNGILPVVCWGVVSKFRIEHPLHQAIDDGSVGRVTFLLGKGADVNGVNSAWTPLQRAVHSGHLAIVTLLIENGADVNSVGNHGYTPLHGAVRQERLEIITLLIEKGADVNRVDNGGYTPLQRAVMEGASLAIITLLIENGADVNRVGNNVYTPLHGAVRQERLEIITLLIEKGADVNRVDHVGYTPLQRAVMEGGGSLAIITLLIENGADVNRVDDEGQAPLYLATKASNLEVVRMLLKAGANPNVVTTYGDTVLAVATRHRPNNAEIVALLKSAGAGTSNALNAQTPPYRAIMLGNIKEVTSLLDLDSGRATMEPIDYEGWTPLQAAAFWRQADVALVLLHLGFNNSWPEMDKADKKWLKSLLRHSSFIQNTLGESNSVPADIAKVVTEYSPIGS